MNPLFLESIDNQTGPAVSTPFFSVETLRRTVGKETDGRLKVAAYTRVSTDLSDQENSFETQERYFNVLLENNPDWTNAGIYSDYALSGTGKEKRTGFRRLLRHCREGRIDRIVTKSISRFARNTGDFLEALETLHESSVTIFFEKEGLDTADPTSGFILTTLAAIAQEESRSISGNINMGNKMRFLRGEVPNHDIYGYRFTDAYDERENGYRCRAVEVVEKEAEVVRWIYQSYLDGMTIREMARILNHRQIPHKVSAYTKKRMENPGKGQLNAGLDDGWTAEMVSGILRNERYAGDVLVQKTYTEDYLTHKSLKNTGEVPQYYVKDHHPAIISRETFEKAKKLRETNSASYKYNGKKRYRAFSGRLICGHCGRFYNIRNAAGNPIWFCPTAARNNGTANCRNEKVYEKQIIRMLRKAITERFRLTDGPVAGNVTASDIISGRCGGNGEKRESFTAEAGSFVSQMLARLVNLRQMDFMERDCAFLKRKIHAAEASLDSCRKRVRILKSRKEAMETGRLTDDTIMDGQMKEVCERLHEEEQKLESAERESKKLIEKLEYMKKYWEELEADHDRREEAIEWMKGLPEGKDGVAAFLNGMTDTYAKAFILSITIHDPLHYTVHWFDDTRTEVEMYSNIEDYRYTAAYFDSRE